MYRKQYGECAKWHWAFWLETFGNSEKYGSGNGMFHFYSEPQHYGWGDSYHLNFFCNPLKKTSYHPNFLINPLKGVGASLFSRCRESWRTEKNVLWILIEVHSVKHELPEFLIVYAYIEDQNISLNGQMTLASIWWLDLTSLLSLHTSVGV